MDEGKSTVLRMLKESDESGKMEMSMVTDGHVDLDELDSGDAFICDFGLTVYIWIGKEANKSEKKEAMKRAVEYLTSEGRSLNIPICRVCEGKEPDHFKKLMREGKEHGWNAEMMTVG